jgi:hypothetical protein
MDRRNFLRSLVGGVAVAAAARTFPFRVFSFPPEIKIVQSDYFGTLLEPGLTIATIRQAVEALKSRDIRPFNGNFTYLIHPSYYKELKEHEVLYYPLSV